MLICTVACPSNVPNCVKFNKLHNLMSILYSPAISQRLTIPLRRRFVSLLWKRLTLRKLFTPWQTKPAIATYHFGSFSLRTIRHKNHSCRHIRNASSHARWSNWEPNQIPWRWRFPSVLNLAMRCPVPCNFINHSIHRLAHNARIGNDIHRRWCFCSWYGSAPEDCRYRTSDDNFISPKCKNSETGKDDVAIEITRLRTVKSYWLIVATSFQRLTQKFCAPTKPCWASWKSPRWLNNCRRP